MAKLELIKNLQQTLKEIKNARAKLDEDIELFRNNSSKGEFFSESLGEKIKEQLEGILKLQKDFSEKYSEIDENCEGTQICILEEKLSAFSELSFIKKLTASLYLLFSSSFFCNAVIRSFNSSSLFICTRPFLSAF